MLPAGLLATVGVAWFIARFRGNTFLVGTGQALSIVKSDPAPRDTTWPGPTDAGWPQPPFDPPHRVTVHRMWGIGILHDQMHVSDGESYHDLRHMAFGFPLPAFAREHVYGSAESGRVLGWRGGLPLLARAR
jgi:hypothetical protein